MTLTTDDLLNRSAAELDELYRQATLGPIPDGQAEGRVLFLTDQPVNRVVSWFVHLLAWQGKVFHRDERYLLNRVTTFGLKLVKANIYPGESWFAPGESIILDYSKTSFVAQKIRDEIREVSPGLFIGQAYWGDQRVLSFSLQFPRGISIEL